MIAVSELRHTIVFDKAVKLREGITDTREGYSYVVVSER